MPRNGSGSFSLAEPPFVPNTVISSTAMNSDLSDIADGLTDSLARNGEGGMEAALALDNDGFVYVSDPDTGMSRSAANTQRVQSGGTETVEFGTDTTVLSGDLIVQTGDLDVVAGSYKRGGVDIALGFGTLTNIASGGTTDLGTLPSHNANITGTTTITSFGSSAAVGEPVYIIRFNAALTLTYNAVSLILPGASNITTAAGDWAMAQYSGSGNWVVTEYNRVTGAAVLQSGAIGSTQGLSVANNAGTPNTLINIAAEQVAMVNPTTKIAAYAAGVSVQCNTTTGGVGTSVANGMDGTARGNSTWYYFYLISDGTTTASLCSASATAPTLPAGYIYKVRVGAKRTDGSGNFYRTRQLGNRVQYVVAGGSNTAAMPILANTAQGSVSVPTWVAVAVASWLPPTAAEVKGVASFTNSSSTASEIIIAPNDQYGSAVSTTNQPPVYLRNPSAQNNSNQQFDLLLESASFYYASTTNAVVLWLKGYTDNVCAS